MGPLHTVSDYALQTIKKMQTEKIRSRLPRQDITDSFMSTCKNGSNKLCERTTAEVVSIRAQQHFESKA